MTPSHRDRHVPVHRHRGFDASVAGRSRRRCGRRLVEHDSILREVVDLHGGLLFKHTGDGVCAVFASRGPLSMPRWRPSGPRVAGSDGYRHRRGRIAGRGLFRSRAQSRRPSDGRGHGGQILLDGATAGLLGDFDIIGLGARRLRDIAKPVEMFQVHAPRPEKRFPPLKTETTPGNLRPPTTSFVGRETELADLETALSTSVGDADRRRRRRQNPPGAGGRDPAGRQLPGRGVGRRIGRRGRPVAVPEAVAAVLGITQQAGIDVAESVAAALEGRKRLLVFDNCEHVLDAAAEMIGAILQQSDAVTIMATSREGLRLADENAGRCRLSTCTAVPIRPAPHCSSSAPALWHRVFRW